jgi:hypothetical protein
MSFTRAAHDWEVEAFASFFWVMYLVTMRPEGENKLWWVSSKMVLFGVKFSTWVAMIVSVSLGKVFGGLRFHSGGIFCVIGGFGKDPYYGQSTEAAIIVVDRCCKKGWGVLGPSSSSL